MKEAWRRLDDRLEAEKLECAIKVEEERLAMVAAADKARAEEAAVEAAKEAAKVEEERLARIKQEENARLEAERLKIAQQQRVLSDQRDEFNEHIHKSLEEQHRRELQHEVDEIAKLEEQKRQLEEQRARDMQAVVQLEQDAAKMIDIKEKKRILAEQLEDFAKRTSALNFDSNEDVAEKKQLLADIDKCLAESDFDVEALTEEDKETLIEIIELVANLKETVQMSLED